MPASKSLWRSIPCARTELHLDATLDGGQSFRWQKHTSIADAWLGCMGNCLWLLRHAGGTHQLQYQVLGELPYPAAADEPHAEVRLKVPRPPPRRGRKTRLLYDDTYYDGLLARYFRLDHPLDAHYRHWSAAHAHFRTEAAHFYRIRQLDQEPVENLFAFICSQNNNIARISQLVERLCQLYGRPICEYDGRTYHAFPDCRRLAGDGVEAELRAAKFGYRARFIRESARQICERGELRWFAELQRRPYAEARAELQRLCGIGAKVADCVCLMSLGHLGAIPVDTHVYQIAARHYMPELSRECKSVPAKVHTAIGERWREVYGPLAGWAQTVLFCADLAKFKDVSAKTDGAADDDGDVDDVKKQLKRKRTV